jgi:hypothetical protein
MGRPCTVTPPPAERVGFLELARHLGTDHDGVAALLDAGAIPFTPVGSVRGWKPVRIVTRAAANEYLRARGKRPLPKDRPEDA